MKNMQSGLCFLLVMFSFGAQAIDENAFCGQGPATSFGQVYYDEVIINRPVEQVWPEILNFAKWQVGHTDAEHITIKGEHGKVNEIFKIIKSHKGAQPYFAETVRLRKNRNVVWRVFSGKPGLCTDALGTSAFLDFHTVDIGGKTLFTTNYYASSPMHEKDLMILRKKQSEGDEGVEFLREGGEAFKKYMESL